MPKYKFTFGRSEALLVGAL